MLSALSPFPGGPPGPDPPRPGPTPGRWRSAPRGPPVPPGGFHEEREGPTDDRFPNEGVLQGWVQAARREGFLPDDAAVYRQDGLDVTKAGVTPANTFIVRRVGERPSQARLA